LPRDGIHSAASSQSQSNNSRTQLRLAHPDKSTPTLFLVALQHRAYRLSTSPPTTPSLLLHLTEPPYLLPPPTHTQFPIALVLPFLPSQPYCDHYTPPPCPRRLPGYTPHCVLQPTPPNPLDRMSPWARRRRPRGADDATTPNAPSSRGTCRQLAALVRR